jgi:xylitol oxidase
MERKQNEEVRVRNWSGTYEYRASAVEAPTSIEEVQALVARSPRIRALGTRHSFNDLADTEGVLVTTTEIPPHFVLDAERRIVTVGAGTRYAALATYLTDEGWALHNMGSLPHISVAGAIATGTHGSGNRNGNLSTAVRALEIVGADGDLRTVRQGDPDFPGSVVALGALGVTTRVTLAVQPRYLVRQDTYRNLPWDTLLDRFAEVSGGAYSVSVFTVWASDDVEQLWVKRRVDDEGATVPDDYFGAVRDRQERPELVEGISENLTRRGTVVPWLFGLPHFRLDTPPSAGDEIQSEYFVDIADAGPALTAMRGLADRVAPHLTLTELRTMSADDLWLSPAAGRDSLAIHFTWMNHPDEVFALLPAIEDALRPFRTRPHWGKLNRFEPAQLADVYPRLGDMRDLVLRTDPQGKFRNEYLERVLGLESGGELPEVSAPMGA